MESHLARFVVKGCILRQAYGGQVLRCLACGRQVLRGLACGGQARHRQASAVVKTMADKMAGQAGAALQHLPELPEAPFPALPKPVLLF